MFILSVGNFLKLTFWASMLVSTSCAIWGVKTKRETFLWVGSISSIPFAFILFGYPGSRFFMAVPLLHLTTLVLIRKRFVWAAWVPVALIVGFSLYFLALYYAT